MSSSINVRLLVTRVQKISDWFMLGVHLGVPKEELSKIDQRFSVSHGVERCKAELFDLWLTRNPSARWDDVASALEQLNEVALASELREICRVSLPSPAQLADNVVNQASPRDEHQQKTVTVNLSKLIVKQFARLESKFASLACNVKTAAEEKVVLPGKLHSFLEVRLNQSLEFFPSTTISDLFKCITPYYCFLNTTLLENIIDEFLGEPLQQQLDEYEGLLEEFTSSTKISLLKEIDLKTSAQHKGMPLVVLKLSGRCLDVTIKRFQELVKHIFGEEANALSNIHVKHGCICITWNTRESAIPSLLSFAEQKIQFMKHVGILRLTVAEITIFEQPGTEEAWEEDNSNLEDYLVQSVLSGCTEAVNFLLKAGADPNQQDSVGMSVLGLASRNGFTEIARLILNAGVDVNQINNRSEKTPLMFACKENHVETVHLLLQSGGDPNRQTLTGLTALLNVDYSSDHRSLSTVKYLLEAGATVNAQDSKGLTSLAKASRCGSYKIAELLIQYGADVQLSTLDKSTPLMVACENDHEDIVALLLDSLADPNVQSIENNTALMIACQRQLVQTVSLLLSSGADPNLQNRLGWTALMISCATQESHEFDNRILTELISAGADPNLQTDTGFTALMLAARYHESGVRILVDAQVDVNAQDRLGNTALHHSEFFGNSTNTQLLLSAGANPILLNSVGKAAVDVALDSHHTSISSSVSTLLMHQYQASSQSDLSSASSSDLSSIDIFSDYC